MTYASDITHLWKGSEQNLCTAYCIYTRRRNVVSTHLTFTGDWGPNVWYSEEFRRLTVSGGQLRRPLA